MSSKKITCISITTTTATYYSNINDNNINTTTPSTIMPDHKNYN